MNTAAACGILANIQHESGFNPRAVFIEADGRISYGICQWNAGRLLALQDYCEQHGYDASSLGGQLQYLQYELTTRERAAFYRVRGVSNTASGAYEAGYNWARYFERCADRYYTGRAETAYLTYWTKYGEADESFVLSIIGETFPPSSMETGSVIDLRGVIRSDAKIIRVSAFIQDASGNIIQSHEQSWNSGRYNLETDGVNQALRFSQLAPGDYIYIIRAADLSGAEKTLIESKFTVGGADNERIPLYAEIPDSEKSQNPQDPENPENPQDLQNPDNAAAVSNTEVAPESGASDVKSGENPDANLLSVPDGTGDINANGGANSGANGGNPDANRNANGDRNGDSVPVMNSDAGLNNSDPGEQTGTPIPESPVTDFNPISDEEWALISQDGYWEPVTPQEQNQEQNQDNRDNQSNQDEIQSENQDENQSENQNDGQSGDMNDGEAAPDSIDTNAPDNNALNALDDLNPSENQTDAQPESVYTEPASPIEPGANPSTQIPASPILPEETETIENQPNEAETTSPAPDETENITPDEVGTANPAPEESEIINPADENAETAAIIDAPEATETGEAVETEDINPADSLAPENNPVETENYIEPEKPRLPEENAIRTDNDI